jgi:hypothetical protein
MLLKTVAYACVKFENVYPGLRNALEMETSGSGGARDSRGPCARPLPSSFTSRS